MTTERTKLIIITGLIATFSVNLLMVFSFYTAYFNGGSVIVPVNTFGEANLEAFVVLPGFFLFICFCIYLSIRDFYDSLWTNKIEFKKPKEVEI